MDKIGASQKCTNSSRSSAYRFPESVIVTVTERDFLHLHTPNAVLGMIKDGSYDAKLAAFLNMGDPPSPEEGGFVMRELFAKDLSQSDVGKRKGLVVPRKDAEEFFPDVRAREGESMRLRFVCRRTARWLEFKYCFYRSSQCYVLTTGWCKFVRENCLKEKDLVKFDEFVKEGGDGNERYIMIDIVRFGEDDVRPSLVIGEEKGCDDEGEIGVGKQTPTRVREEVMVARKRRHKSCEVEKKGGERVRRTVQERNELIETIEKEKYNAEKGVRLFGVVIG